MALAVRRTWRTIALATVAAISLAAVFCAVACALRASPAAARRLRRAIAPHGIGDGCQH